MRCRSLCRGHLPDVRDGLKPVQRRIVYAMYEANMDGGLRTSQESHRRWRRHGQVPPTFKRRHLRRLVRMGQDFSLRHPLVDPQGNFGTHDRCPPAAMRYTECRLALLLTTCCEGIDEKTVDWIPNYDGEQRSRRCCRPDSRTCWSTDHRDRGGHGDEHPAAQPGRGHRCLHLRHRQPGCSGGGATAVRQGPDFPTGAYIVGHRRHQRRPADRSRIGQDAGRHRCQEVARAELHCRDRTAVSGLGETAFSTRSRPWSTRRRSPASADLRNESAHAVGPDHVRTEEGRRPSGGAQPALQADPTAENFGVNTVALVDGFRARSTSPK